MCRDYNNTLKTFRERLNISLMVLPYREVGKLATSCRISFVQRGVSTMKMHFRCRGEMYPTSDVRRYAVADDAVPWSKPLESYAPSNFTSPRATNQPWADPTIGAIGFIPRWNELDGQIDRRSHQGHYQIVDGYPRNPIGRTGIRGRGLLGRWGPNHAADPIVTRWKREASGEIVLHQETKLPVLQFVAIQRGDTKEWAIPGGMVDPGETVTKTLQREFGEEALNSLKMSAEEKAEMHAKMKVFFGLGVEVYKGYVDDPRNTDNAWMETVAMNFHDADATFVSSLQLNAGDDAVKVHWMDLGKEISLYASHQSIVELVAQMKKAHWGDGPGCPKL